MNLSLRRGEKLYLNGAVIRVDRKVSLELLNDATFLLEQHVMQPEEATTPLKRLYFVIQTMLISPTDIDAPLAMCRHMLSAFKETSHDFAILEGLTRVAREIEKGKNFEALRIVRGLFNAENDASLKVVIR